MSIHKKLEIMAKTQLMINGKTGAELEALLTEMGFVVPEIQEYPLTPYPPETVIVTVTQP